MQHIGENGQDVRALPAHERQALEAGDIRSDFCVQTDGQNICAIRAVAGNEIEARLVCIKKPLEVKKRRGVGKNLDGVVAGAARIVRHRRILEACHPAHDLVERAVAAAGIHPQLLAGGRLRSDLGACIHGRGRDIELVSVLAALKRAARLLGNVFAPVLAAGDGIDDEQMFHSEFLHFRQNNTTTIPRAARTRKGKIVNICGFLTTGVSICTGLPPHTSFVYWNRSRRSVPL